MQDVSKYLNIPKETEFNEFETRLEFIKFALNLCKRKDKNVKEKEYSMCLWNHHCNVKKPSV